MRPFLASQALLALLAISFLAWIAWVLLDIPTVLAWARSLHGPIPALVLIPLQTAISLSFSPIPSDVVGIALCAVYGFTRGAFCIWIAWMLGAWIEYALVRRIASRVDEEAARAKLPEWLQNLPVDHPAFLVCGRWFPLGPHLVNSAAGAAGVSIWRYAWTAATGIAVSAIVVAAIATGLLAAGTPERKPEAPPDLDSPRSGSPGPSTRAVQKNAPQAGPDRPAFRPSVVWSRATAGRSSARRVAHPEVPTGGNTAKEKFRKNVVFRKF